MNLKKISALGFIFTTIGTTVYAQENNNIRVQANTVAGCNVEGSNIEFGIMTDDMIGQEKDVSLNVQCSKGINFNLTIKTVNNPDGGHGSFLMHESETEIIPQGDVVRDVNRYIPYAIRTNKVVNNSEYSIAHSRSDYWLPGHKDWSANIYVASPNKLKIPLTVRLGIAESARFISTLRVLPGNYKDTLTYVLTY